MFHWKFKFILKHAFWLLLEPHARSHLKMSAQIDQRIFSNKCIDRPNGKLHDWGSFTQRTAAALVVYLLTVPIHAVPSIFCLPEHIFKYQGCHWNWILGRLNNMVFKSENKNKKYIYKNLGKNTFLYKMGRAHFSKSWPNFQYWALFKL